MKGVEGGHLKVQPPQVSISPTVENLCRAEFVKSEILHLGFIAVLVKKPRIIYRYLCRRLFFITGEKRTPFPLQF